MNQTLEYGPYTPQEVERIAQWLKSNHVNFELSKDAESEKLEMMNDGKNIVEKAEFRTSVYLGQIFYVHIMSISENQKAQFEKLFQAGNETYAQKPISASELEDQNQVKLGIVSHNEAKRNWAIAVIILLVVPIILSLINIFSKKGL